MIFRELVPSRYKEEAAAPEFDGTVSIRGDLSIFNDIVLDDDQMIAVDCRPIIS